MVVIISHRRVIPSEAVTERCGHRHQFASWSNILLISIEITKQGKSVLVRAQTSTKLEHLTWIDSENHSVMSETQVYIFDI